MQHVERVTGTSYSMAVIGTLWAGRHESPFIRRTIRMMIDREHNRRSDRAAVRAFRQLHSAIAEPTILPSVDLRSDTGKFGELWDGGWQA